MGLDTADKIASVVGGAIAVYLLLRDRRRWWSAIQRFSAERQAVERPGAYRFDAPVRALHDVYVPRFAVRRGRPAGPPVPTDDIVLRGTTHTVLIGEPGGGKTALLHHAVATSARQWLAGRRRPWHLPPGPVVVRITARDLIGRSLAQAVAAECDPWSPEPGRPPAPRRCLLVCVDGLDAVADPGDRSAVLDTLAGAGPAEHWRLLVATRQLSEPELRALKAFTVHHLVPFTDDDVNRLARAWFAEQAPPFLAWLRAQPLGACARSPLLTTVAAVLWEAGAPDPTGSIDPVGLLERFTAVLLDAGRPGIDELLDAMVAGDPAVAPHAAWLKEHRRALVEAAATAWLAGHGVVAGVAGWAGPRLPSPAPGPTWPGRLREILLRTGIFRPEGRDLAPTWPGLAEYLASGPLSRDLRPDTWTATMSDTARQGVGSWAIERAAAPAGFLLDALAQPDGPLVVGRLITAGGPVPDDIRETVLSGLLTHRSPAAEDLLTTLAAHRDHLACLGRLAQDVRRPTEVRHAAQLFFARHGQRAGTGPVPR